MNEEQQSKVDVIKAVGRLLFIFLMRDYYIGSLQSWGAHRAAQEIGLQVKISEVSIKAARFYLQIDSVQLSHQSSLKVS